MTERVVALVLLGIVTLCLVIITVECVMTLHEARRTLKQLNGLFGLGHRLMEALGAMVGRVHRVSRDMESVMRRGYALFEQWPHQLGGLLMRRWGNGVGVEPRRRPRAESKRR